MTAVSPDRQAVNGSGGLAETHRAFSRPHRLCDGGRNSLCRRPDGLAIEYDQRRDTVISDAPVP